MTAGAGGEHTVSAGFLTVPAERLTREGAHDLLLEECFGPVTVIARYTDEAEARAVLSRLPGNLTATVHLSSEEAAGQGRGAELVRELTPLAGRVLVNGWPTGVAVAPPSTTAAPTRRPPPRPPPWAARRSSAGCGPWSTRAPPRRCCRRS
ncbi:hypothetical protein ACFQV4_04145 [Streptomyces thermocarboxydus]